MEEWREIPGTLYSVSSEGRVESRKRGRVKILRLCLGSNGYYHVTIFRSSKRDMQAVHVLVAEAFLGPRPTPGHEVNHKDGIKTNNQVANLEWVTHSENQRHRCDVLKHGNARGEAHGFAKVTEAEVREIRVRRAAGESLAAIAADYGIGISSVCMIAKGQHWAWLT